MVPRAR